jgi:predicted dehydrogenase
MNERQRTAKARLRLIVAHTPRNDPPVQTADDGVLSGLRDVPGLSLRVGRHVTAWVLWHTARVSLIADAPPPAELDRAARV